MLVYGKQGQEIFRKNLDPSVCREVIPLWGLLDFHCSIGNVLKQKTCAFFVQACLYSLENKVPLIAFGKDRCLSLFDHPSVDSLHTVYNEPKVPKDYCFIMIINFFIA